MADKRPSDGGNEAPEASVRSGLRKAPGHGFIQESYGPAPDDAVVGQDYQWSDYGQRAYPFPSGTGREFSKGPEGRRMRAAPDYGFRKEDGKREEDHAKEIDEDEGRASVLADHVREAPDIAEAYRRPRHGHHGRHSAAEVLPLRRHAKG